MQDSESISIKKNIPKYPVLIITCIDPRIDIFQIFQLNPGDVFIFRNAGNVYTNDMLRSLLVSIIEFDIKYIVVLGHLDCGMAKINLKECRDKLPSEFLSHLSKNHALILSELNDFFKPFNNEVENIKKQIKTLDTIKNLFSDIEITGMLYDVKTGLVFEYNLFKDYKSFENFEKKFKEMIIYKKNQFQKFSNSIKSEENSSNKIEYSQKENELVKDESYSNQQVSQEIRNSSIYKNEQSEEINMKSMMSIMSKISIPKIHVQRVKVYIPNIVREKKQILD